MASAVPSCDICGSRGFDKEAMAWCSECDDLLCSLCDEHHSISKASKNHKTLSIDDYRNIPAFLMSVKTKCDVHDSEFEFYCTVHDDPCCVQCMHMTHKVCNDIKPLNEIVKNIKTSALVESLEITIKEIANGIKLLITKSRESIESLTFCMEKCRTEVQELRQTIEEHLKNIEKQILDKLSSHFTDGLKQKTKLTKNLEEAETRINNMVTDITNIRNHASERQTFLGLKEIEKLAQSEKCFAESVIEHQKIRQTQYTFIISPAIFYIKNDSSLLGKLSIVENTMDIPIETFKGINAQIIIPCGINIYQYRVKNRWQIKMPVGINPIRLTGCTVLPTAEIVIADKTNDRLIIFEAGGTLKKELAVVGSPVDVAYTGQRQVAVTLSNKSKIKFINMENGITSYKMSLTSAAYGISVSGDDMIVRVKDSGFLYTDKTRRLVRMVPVSDESILYVTYQNEKFYYTKWDENIVACCDGAGNTIWTFHNGILKKPCGITIENGGNIFVAGFESNNIVLISENGKQYRELLSESDNLNNPTAIDYNNETNQLAIVNLEGGMCNVFEIHC